MKLRILPIIFLFFTCLALTWAFSAKTPPASLPQLPASPTPAAQNEGQLLSSPPDTFITPLPTAERNIIEDEETPDGDLPDDIESRPLITGVIIPTASPTAKPYITPISTTTPTKPDANLAPPVAALQELAEQNSGDQNDRIRGRRSGGAPPETPVPPVSPLPTLGTPEPTPTPRPALPRVSGQARGYVMLPLMQQRARPAMERQIEILLNSQVNDLYVSVLVDGTFGEDFEYLDSVIRKLNVGSRTLTLELYLSSGPTMRRWDRTPIQTFFSQINPEDFRYLISDDQAVRNEVKRLASKSREAFALNGSLNEGNQNYVSVMLEDNLDYDSYRTMRSLVARETGDSATFIRNPCPGCFRGNDDDTQGDPLELHERSDLPRLGIGDGYTLDGVHVQYPGEPSKKGVSIEELKAMLEQSQANGNSFFGLWRAQRQGLGDQLIHPQDRNYEVATTEHEALEIDLLRHGLIPIINEEPSPSDTTVESRLFEFEG